MENKSVLTYENKKFYFSVHSDEQEKMAKNIALAFDYQSLRWVTRNVYKAIKLRAFADDKAEKIFKKTFITIHKRPEEIIYPDHLEPRLFQIKSAVHALTRSPAYIADEPGLGKTITAIMCMNTIPGRAFILCPPYLKYNWQDEIHKWSTSRSVGEKPIIIENGKSINEAHLSNFTIVPDSLLNNENVLQYIRRERFLWGFIDEAHRYKDDQSKRTKALIKTIAEQCDRMVFLSGTPIPNARPMEIYPIASALAPEAIGYYDYPKFGKLFCDGKEKIRYQGRQQIREWDFSGRSNLSTLNKLLFDKFMIRHEKKDVLTELPPKTRQLIFLDKPKRIEKYERAVLNNNSLSSVLGDEYNLGHVATYRRECGIAKIKPSSEFIADQLDALHEPHLVFAYHIEVVEGLEKNLERFNPIVIRGGLTAKEKNKRIKKFKNNSNHHLIIGNIDAMGTGLTLTKAKEAIFVEYSWVPGINIQAEDRIHRISQEKNTRFRYLVMRDSLDERQLISVLDKEIAGRRLGV